MQIKGKAGITAKIIQDSISHFDKRITTFELDYPRFIHAELMTHRMFSRNAASSRAIPVNTMHQLIRDNPATPVVWQKNQPGMQSTEDLIGIPLEIAQQEWNVAAHMAVDSSKALLDAGLHKQWANRPTEPFQMMKTIVTATEYDNWFNLRDHSDAQPEIHELASCMRQAMEASEPMRLNYNEWHVPYVERRRTENTKRMYYVVNDQALTDQQAIKVSASCCAQVSYRKLDDTLEKAEMIYDRLINSKPMHASPIEHQATPLKHFMAVDAWNWFPGNWEDGITHIAKDGRYGSGNFYGWLQYRQLI